MARQFSVMGNERHQAIVVRLCKRAVELDPVIRAAWAAMAMAQREMFRAQRVPTTMEIAAPQNVALALDPGLADAYAALGQRYQNEGRAEFDEGL